MMRGQNFFKGELKLLILKSLTKEPLHGYKLMKTIEACCMNLWKPTPGSLYPALEELKKQGLIAVRKEAKTGRRKKEYEITRLGRKRHSELAKNIEGLEKEFLQMHKDPELSQYTIEDGMYLLNTIKSLVEGELSAYKGTMLEFAMLSRQGKVSKKQEEEFKNAVIAFVKKTKQINDLAKQNSTQ